MGSVHFESTYDNSRLINGINQDNRTVGQWATNIQKQGGAVEQTFKNMAQAAAAYVSVQFAARIGSEIIKVRGEFQQLGIAFETMLGSKAKADQLMQEAITFAAKTPFTLTDVASNIKQLMAMGIATEDVMGTMKSLGDVAAGVSVPISRIAINYGQVATMGKLQGRELRDFAMAGIPLIDELAKNLGKAKNEIQEMVSAGQIGFKDVEKAFQTMSGEGGKFFNLMEEQNLSVTGQISNLTDKVQVMLNEIGKANEGIIYGGISGIAGLVDHYKGILDVLKVVAATYGTYKAAVIAAAVAQKLMMFAENVQLIAMFRKELGLATAAQQAFNISTKANPYGLILAGITAVVTALVLFNKRTKEAYVVGAEYNKSLTEEKEKLNSLFEQVKKTAEGTDDRSRAIKDANGFLKEYNISLTDEKGNLVDLQAAYKEAETAVDQFIGKQAKNRELAEAGNLLSSKVLSDFQGSQTGRGKLGSKLDNSEINTLQNFVKENAELINKTLASKPAGYSPSKEEIARFEEFQQKLNTAISSSKTLSDINKYDTSTLQNFLKDSAGQLIDYRDRVKEINSFYDALLDTGGKSKDVVKTVQQQIDETTNQLKAAEAFLNEMRKGSSKVTKDEISAQEEVIKSLKSSLETLTGIKKKDVENSKKTEEEIYMRAQEQLKAQKEINEEYSKRIGLSRKLIEKYTNKNEKGEVSVTEFKPDVITRKATETISKSLMSVMKLKTTSYEIEMIWDNIDTALKDPAAWDNVARGFGELSNAFSGIDEAASKMFDTLGQIANSTASLVEGISSGNFIQSITSAISIVSEIIKASTEENLRLDLNKNLEEVLANQADALQRQLDLLRGIKGLEGGEVLNTGLEALNSNLDSSLVKLRELARSYGKQSYKYDFINPDNLDQDMINKQIANIKESIAHDKLKYGNDLDTAASSWNLDKVLAEWENIDKSFKERQAWLEEQNSKLTGTTLSSIMDEIVKGFESGKNKVSDFADTTETLIKNALMRAFEVKFLESQLEQWYKDFAAAGVEGYTSDEISTLQDAINKIYGDAAAGLDIYNKILADAGLGAFGKDTTASGSGLTGSIQNMTEETGSELAGVLRKSSDDTRSIRDYTKIGIDHLVNIEANTYNTVVELKSAVTELRQINTNTRQGVSARDLGV